MRRRCCGDALAGSAMLFSSMSASSFSAGSFFRRWLGQGGPYIQPIPVSGNDSAGRVAFIEKCAFSRS